MKERELFNRLLRKVGYEIQHAPHFEDAFAAQRTLITAAEPVIFDIGANVGDIALRYRQDFPQATLHCFEPFPASFAQLTEKTAGDEKIQRHALAVAEQCGTANLHVHSAAPMNSLLPNDERADQYWDQKLFDDAAQLTVETVTVDAFAAREQVGHIDILKIDVQGGEYAVLQGAQQLLRAQQVGLVYLEIITVPSYRGQHQLHEYLSFFANSGYELFDMYHLSRAKGRLIQLDSIFVSRATLTAYEQRTADPS